MAFRYTERDRNISKLNLSTSLESLIEHRLTGVTRRIHVSSDSQMIRLPGRELPDTSLSPIKWGRGWGSVAGVAVPVAESGIGWDSRTLP